MSTIKDVVVREASEKEKAQLTALPIWSAQPSEFDWEYTQKETCLIIEGRVTLTDQQGKESISFGKGDVVIFPDALSCRWIITESVSKHYKFD